MNLLFTLILNVPFLPFKRIYPHPMERNIDPFLAIRRAPELILFSNPPCKLAHVQQMTGLNFTMPTFFLIAHLSLHSNPLVAITNSPTMHHFINTFSMHFIQC